MGRGEGEGDEIPLTPEEVLDARSRLGLSQAAFSKAVGLSGRAATIAEWEAGVVPPSITREEMRERLDAKYGVMPDASDRDRYTASVFAMLEGDAEMIRGVAERQLAKIREARRTISRTTLTPPTPSQVAAAVRASQKTRKTK